MPKNNEFFQVLWSSTVEAGLFVPQIHGNQVLQLEREFFNVKFSCLSAYNKQQKIISVKAKNLDRIHIFLAEKLKSVMATKCFHLATSSYNEHNSVLLMGGRSRSNSVEEITL